MTKKYLKLILPLLAIVILFCSCSNSNSNVNVDEQIDAAVKQTLVDNFKIKKKFGECKSEGHYVLGYEKKLSGYEVYAVTRAGAFGFENGNFVIVEGTTFTPAIIELNNNFELKKFKNYNSIIDYEAAVNSVLPEQYAQKAIDNSIDIFNDIREQQFTYAKTYLEEIGRDAEVGETTKFQDSYVEMSDYRVLDSIYHKLMAETPEVIDYPFWIGTKESVEDGVRYVYETSINLTQGYIKYTKYAYDIQEVSEVSYYSVETGEKLD